MYDTRAQILAAAEAIPLGSHPYSEVDMPGVPRYDCSLFVATCLGLPTPGAWDTVTLVTGGAIVPTDTPLPGDMWGLCGPGTAGPTGHVAIIVSAPEPTASWWEILEQTGPDGTPGPHLNTYTAIPAGYQTYRSAYLTDGVTVDNATVMAIASGTAADGSGYLDPTKLTGADSWAATQALQHNIALVQEQLTALAAQVDKVLAALAAAPAVTGLVPHTHAELDHTMTVTGGTTGPAIAS